MRRSATTAEKNDKNANTTSLRDNSQSPKRTAVAANTAKYQMGIFMLLDSTVAPIVRQGGDTDDLPLVRWSVPWLKLDEPQIDEKIRSQEISG